MTSPIRFENSHDFLERIGGTRTGSSKGLGSEGGVERIARDIQLTPEEEAFVKGKGGEGDFASQLKAMFNEVNKDLKTADHLNQKLAAGQPVDLHDVMVSMEKAEVSYKMLMAVRSKLMNAYQEVMKMNI